MAMIQIDETIFDRTGLGDLTKEEKDRMLTYVVQTLETRVGIRFAKAATTEQLAEFDAIAKTGDSKKVTEWLKQSFPDYEVMVREELQKIEDDLADAAPDVLAA